MELQAPGKGRFRWPETTGRRNQGRTQIVRPGRHFLGVLNAAARVVEHQPILGRILLGVLREKTLVLRERELPDAPRHVKLNFESPFKRLESVK
jgi:hypothetical protein